MLVTYTNKQTMHSVTDLRRLLCVRVMHVIHHVQHRLRLNIFPKNYVTAIK